MKTSTLSSATSSPVARALDATERERLAQLEPIIERGMASFVEVGTALLEISDHRLYRETHSTFQEYVADRWQMTARRAYQLCTAAEVVKSLPVNNCSHSLITNEAQARELAKVEPEKRAKVLEVTAGKGEVTARSIQETAAQVATPFERNQCGDRFTPENSADGDGHRCPSCNKFGRFVPGPGAILELAGTINQIRYLALVAHAIQPGFCHVTVMSGDSDNENTGLGLLEFTTKPIRADGVEHMLEYIFRAPATEWRAQMQAEEHQGEPWKFNELGYSSYQDYIDRAILGKGRTAA